MWHYMSRSKLQATPAMTVLAPAPTECMRRCEDTKLFQCVAVNFRHDYQICELLDKNRNTYGDNCKDEGSWDYYEYYCQKGTN